MICFDYFSAVALRTLVQVGTACNISKNGSNTSVYLNPLHSNVTFHSCNRAAPTFVTVNIHPLII